MNASDFPIPHPMQGPFDELAHADSILHILGFVFEEAIEHGMTKDVASDVYSMLSDVRHRIEPLMEYLNRSDLENDDPQLFARCRRNAIMRKGGAS